MWRYSKTQITDHHCPLFTNRQEENVNFVHLNKRFETTFAVPFLKTFKFGKYKQNCFYAYSH